MPKTDLVACFYWEQDSQLDKPAKTLSRAEVRELKKQGLGFFIDHGTNFRLCDPTPLDISNPEFDAVNGKSDPCISDQEMLANVGIVRDGLRNERGLIQMAQKKVRWYPHVFDEQAALARGYYALQLA